MPPRLLIPDSLEEALDALARHGDDAKVLAGGTALMVMMRTGLVQPDLVVSLERVPGLDQTEVTGGGLRLGASVTLREAETAPEVAGLASVLAETLPLVANVRVRNAATIGGNVAEADYASDPPCVLLALDATVEVMSTRGIRTIPLGDFLVDYYETVLEPDELVTAVHLPALPPGARATYLKYLTRSCEDRPCVGAVAVVTTDGDGRCTGLRVAVGAAGPVPYRVPEAEDAAAGVRLDETMVADVAEAYARAARPLSDLRGSAEYRRKMISVFVRRAIRAAASGQTGGYKA